MDIKFHCDIDYNFPTSGEQVRAFIYQDYAIELHTHSFYEINIVTAGSGTHRISHATISVRPGDVFLIPPMVPHAYYDTKNLDVLHILIKPEVITDHLAEAETVKGFVLFTEIEPFLRAASGSSPFLQLTQKDQLLLRGDLELLMDNSPFHSPDTVLLRLHTLWKILYLFSFLLAKQNEHKPPADKYERQIVDTLEYIHSNIHRTITERELYERAFLSRSTFLRSFSKICGCTPAQYIADHRMKKALELMETGQMTKTAVARACGYYDLSHMAQAFNKQHKRAT